MVRSAASSMPNGMRSGVSLLIDIENCIKTQQSAGHERWAKIENLKRAVRTMVFLDQHGFSRYTDLEKKITELQDSNGQTAATLKASERCLSDLALLIKYTATYKELNISALNRALMELELLGYARQNSPGHFSTSAN